ncbi:hypothetical protein Sango_2436000 [Sesamum angolense]|uniref:Reverse transcriptase domain-containing protein n=1 Tax=Sesamum angolense TaxID=2727404 RepID=A0AAE2BK52_9LAMI|nr:hypothetical protein Sango_2436000 [Sesamum angolense]
MNHSTDFASKEAVGYQPPSIWQSLKKEMVELRQQVTNETMPVERGIPLSEHMMAEELLLTSEHFHTYLLMTVPLIQLNIFRPKGSEEGPQLLKPKYFYKYHRKYEHDTNRCRQLRQEIARLIKTVVSTYHMKLKFPVGNKVGEVKGDQYTMRICYVEAIKSSNRMKVNPPSNESSLGCEVASSQGTWLRRKGFEPRLTIIAQALAKFVNGATLVEDDETVWLLHADGSFTLIGGEARVVLTSLVGDEMEYALRFDFKASNNDTEYENLIAGIRIALYACRS